MSGLTSSRHDIISLEMLSIPEDLPWRRIYAPRSISSLVIAASKGPTSVVFWGSLLLSVSLGFCKTFLKCACQFSPEIPAIKFRSFGLCSSLDLLLLHFGHLAYVQV